MKVGGGRGIVEKKRNRIQVEKSTNMNVEYSVVGCKVVAPFIIIFGMCRREGA
jgi:hypothetical protein